MMQATDTATLIHRELFEEMPAPVQLTAFVILGTMRGGRSSWSQDYPTPIAKYLAATGFFDANLTTALHENKKTFAGCRWSLNDVSRAALQDWSWMVAAVNGRTAEFEKGSK